MELLRTLHLMHLSRLDGLQAIIVSIGMVVSLLADLLAVP